jgi:hypothetical protein
MDNTTASKDSKFMYGLLVILTGGLILPVGGHFILHAVSADTFWNQVPLHSTMEAVGAIALIILAVLLQTLQKDKGTLHYVWISSGLICIGFLNIFHAAVLPGNIFVWLYCFGLLLGSFFFFLVWLPEEIAAKPFSQSLPIIAFIASVFTGVFLLIFKDNLPLLIMQGSFTLMAKWINVISGILFGLSAIFFLIRFQRQMQIEDIILTVLSTLFASAATMFPLSSAWSPDWWLWHILRMMACLVSLIYVFIIFRKINSLTLRITEREQARLILEGILKEVSETVNVLSSATTEILTATTQVAASATETATAVTQTTTTVEEVRQTALLSSQKALGIQDSSQKVTEAAHTGMKAVKETMEGMETIQKQMNGIADIVVALSEQSQTIGEITPL